MRMNPFSCGGFSFFCIFLLLSAVSVNAANGVSARLDSARALLTQHKYTRGREMIRRILHSNPDNPHALYAGARILTDADSAQMLYERLTRMPSVPETLRAQALTALGEKYFIEGDCEQAEKLWQKAVDAGNRDALGLVRRCGEKSGVSDAVESVSGMQVLVQLGSFSSRENAQALKNELRSAFGRGEIREATVKGKHFYRVYVPGFANKAQAQRFARRQLEPEGYSSYTIRRETD